MLLVPNRLHSYGLLDVVPGSTRNPGWVESGSRIKCGMTEKKMGRIHQRPLVSEKARMSFFCLPIRTIDRIVRTEYNVRLFENDF